MIVSEDYSLSIPAGAGWGKVRISEEDNAINVNESRCGANVSDMTAGSHSSVEEKIRQDI
jgi:hypothetical protein